MARVERFWVNEGRKRAGAGARFRQGTFQMIMLSVGPGEAIFLEAGQTAALVDGGAGHHYENEVLAARLRSWIEARDLRLKLFIASHPHVDHLNALPILLRTLPESRFAPRAAFYHNGKPHSNFAQRLIRQVQGLSHLKEAMPTTPRTVKLGPRTTVRLFMDGSSRHGTAYQSVMALVKHGEARFLLTGDVYADYERKLIQTYPKLLPAQVLKVTHHGSQGGTSREFLNAVHPKIALASTALKPDGSIDPSHNIDKATAERLREKRVRVYETAGAEKIEMTTDGVPQEKGILFEAAVSG